MLSPEASVALVMRRSRVRSPEAAPSLDLASATFQVSPVGGGVTITFVCPRDVPEPRRCGPQVLVNEVPVQVHCHSRCQRRPSRPRTMIKSLYGPSQAVASASNSERVRIWPSRRPARLSCAECFTRAG